MMLSPFLADENPYLVEVVVEFGKSGYHYKRLVEQQQHLVQHVDRGLRDQVSKIGCRRDRWDRGVCHAGVFSPGGRLDSDVGSTGDRAVAVVPRSAGI